MALKTAEECVERLKRMKPNAYAHGKKIRRDDPLLELPINTLKLTFDAATDPEGKAREKGSEIRSAPSGGERSDPS